jgi:putative ABC transport system substrate-binding protein
MYQVFVEAMRVLGYVEGRNVVFESRHAYGAVDRLPGLAAELTQVPVDVIVSGGNISTAAAKQATSTIPIVMVFSVDPDVYGFIRSYSHPGGNITGLTYGIATSAYGKRLELLKEIVPGLAKVGVLIQKGQGVNMAAPYGPAAGGERGPHVG